MPTTATPTASQTRTLPSPKQQFLDAFEREHEKTMRVLRAYPAAKSELRPHAKCKTARELAWMFVLELGTAEKVLTTGFDWSSPPRFPPAPASLEAVLGAIEQGHQRVGDLLRGAGEDELFETVKFFTGPGTIEDMAKMQFLWMMLSDQIHHRGQFTIYLRMADGKVPSVYGPTLDEPWF
ncbi:MAG: DinB family protein [Acidobacteriota bacterium]